ncbi:MAG: hypothetical protein ABR517_02300 [Thermoanaerobaculia bacterium]
MFETRRALSSVFIFLLLVAVPLSAQISDVYIVPAAADASGGAGTYWMTDFHAMNPQAYPLRATLVYLPTGGAVGSAFKFDIGANETVWADNIVAQFDDATVSTGSLLLAVLPEDNPGIEADDYLGLSLVLQTRTYNTTPSGTLGQGIPGAITGLLDIDLDGLSAIATGIRNFGSAGINGFRANVGALNLGRSDVTLQVVTLNADGVEVGSSPLILPPQGHLQQTLPVSVDHGSIEFWVEDPDPNEDDFVFPYVSIVDNRTGDATYIEPKLLAAPSYIAPFKTGRRSASTPIRTDQVRRVIESARYLGIATVEGSGRSARIKGPTAN